MADPELLVAARTAVASNQRNVARGLLVQIVRADQTNGEAWHLLGQVLDDPAQKDECAQRARAAGYQPEARRIIFPVEPVAEPVVETKPPVAVSIPAVPKATPAPPTDIASLRATVTSMEKTPRRQPPWMYAAIGVVVLLIVIVIVLLIVWG
jgi:hypothetical protein